MSVLLYCVFHARSAPPLKEVVGVNGGSVSVVTGKDLAAAVSTLSGFSGVPLQDSLPVEQMMAYLQVIEHFHQQHTVIPMRLGAVFENVHSVTGLLEKHHESLKDQLDEIDGCVEMGIRILDMQPSSDGCFSGPPHDETLFFDGGTAGKGKNYLQSRRAYYEKKDREAGPDTSMEDSWFPALFEGLFVKLRKEKSPLQPGLYGHVTGLTSFHFLVRKKEMSAFYAVFHGLPTHIADRALLSGPWPPYNFVMHSPLSLAAH